MRRILEYLLYIFVFLLPFQTRWIISDPLINGDVWEFGRISIYSFDIVYILILSIFLILNFKSFKIKNIKYILLAILFVVLNFIVADNKLIDFYWLLRIFQGISLIWMFSKIYPVKSATESRSAEQFHWINFNKIKFIWTFIASMGLSAILGIYQFLTQSSFASKWLGLAIHSASVSGHSVIESAGERWLRAYGTFPHPNIFAGFLVIAIILCIYLINKYNSAENNKTSKFNIKKIFLFFIFLILSTAIFFTFSRAAWIAVVCIIFYNIFFLKKKKMLPIVCLILFILLSVIYLPLVKTRIAGTERLEVKSNIERMSGYSQAFQIIKKNPLLGVGVGNYTAELQKMYSDQSAWHYQPVHNVYLLILTEVGIIGIILITLLLYYFIQERRKKKEEKEEGFRNLNPYFLFSLFSFLFFFDHYWYTLPSGMLIIFLLFGFLNNFKLQNIFKNL